MKKFLLLSSFLFVAISLFAESEPNDVSAQSSLLTIDVVSSGALISPDDLDWWKVVVDGEGILTITTTSDAALCAISYLYDENMLEIDNNYAPSCSQNIRTITQNNIGAGTYYIKTTRFSGDGNYTITANFSSNPIQSEPEPNDTIISANNLTLSDSIQAHIGYRVNGKFDRIDWFKITTTQDSELAFTTKSDVSACIVIYLYDSLMNRLADTYAPACSQKIKSLSVPNLQPGTYFIKVEELYSQYGAYWLINTVTPSAYKNDPEPNDSIEIAKTILVNDSIEGHINYYNNGKIDSYDWYKINIPYDGSFFYQTTGQSNTCMIVDIYDSLKVKISTTEPQFCSTNPKSERFANMAKGTFYLRVWTYHSANNGGYKLKTILTPPLYTNDTEANDSVQIAKQIPLNDTIQGHIGYYTTKKDNVDWFKIVTKDNGMLTFGTLTENSSTCLCTYLYDKKMNFLGSTEPPSCGVNPRYTSVGNLPADTFYLRLSAYYGEYGSYKLSTLLTPRPKAAFSINQNFYSATFTDSSLNNPTKYSWDFGDGKTSQLVNPEHTFAGPGAYAVTLIAENPSGIDTCIKYVEIRGIQKIISNKAGNAGEATIFVHGGGFIKTSNVTLKKNGSPDLIPDTCFLSSVGVLTCRFKMTGVELGTYDVVVKNPSQEEMILAQAFIVEQAKAADPWIQLIGRDRVLFNRWSTYTINYGNNGNIDAWNTPIWIAITDVPGLSVDMSDLNIKSNTTLPSQLRSMYDTARLYVLVDSFMGEAMKVRLYPLMLYNIPANSSLTKKIKIKTASSVSIMLYSSESEVINTGLKSSNSAEIYQAILDCKRAAALAAFKDGIVDIGVNVIEDVVPGVGCAKGIYGEYSQATGTEERSWGSAFWDWGGLIFDCGSVLIPFDEMAKASWSVASGTFSIIGKIHKGYSANSECDEKFRKEPINKNNIRAVSSFDPNEMIGPRGFNSGNCIRKQNYIPYTITFENKKMATAPAAEVAIYDTLNVSMYDWKTFSFGSYGFGDTTFTLPSGLKEFSRDVDLRPGKPIIVRISGSLDTINGIIFWKYTSLDPTTMDVTEDPDAGFLPPNNASPEGEGAVSFSVGLKSSLKNSDVVKNKAAIIFDYNPAIITNEYSNTLDEKAPESTLEANLPNAWSDAVNIQWSGDDTESGILRYSIKVDNGDSTYYWKKHTSEKSGTFKGLAGKTYRFTCIAEDSLGLSEVKTLSDAQIIISGINHFNHENKNLVIYPNPAKDKIQVLYSLANATDISILITNAKGEELNRKQIEHVTPGKHSIEFNIENYPSGIYFIRISTESDQINEKFMIIK